MLPARGQAVRPAGADTYPKARLSTLPLAALGQEWRRLRQAIRESNCPADFAETSYVRWLMAEVATRLDGQSQAVVLHTLGEPDGKHYDNHATGGPWEELRYYWGPPGGPSCKVGFRCLAAHTMRSIWYSGVD